jgi:hypothetical protein
MRCYFLLILLLVAGCADSSDSVPGGSPDSQSDTISQPSSNLPSPFPASTAKGIEAVNACASALPPFVPWPPPRPTERYVFPAEVPHRFKTLAEFDSFLEAKLKNAGYDSFSYFSAPGGFSLATKVEQVNEEREPVAENRRWIIEAVNEPLSFKEYFLSLLRNKIGRYRVLVFVLTTDPRPPGPQNATPDEAIAWADHGCTSLSPAVGRIKITAEHVFYVLSYEFSASKDRHVEQVYSTPVKLIDQLKLSRLAF